jgi:hypothetical protein
MNDLTHAGSDLDWNRRHAQKPAGPVRLGSEEHQRLFCLELLETHDPYRPAVIDWPGLDPVTRSKVVSLPIWDIAVQTEGRAGMNVRTFVEGLAPGLLKDAVEMNPFEETRHKTVLANMVAYYGVDLEPEPPYRRSRDPEWWRRPWFELKVIAVWLFLVWERIGVANRMENSEKAKDNNFTLNGSKELGVEITFPQLARICLEENEHRLAPYDARLIRPVFVPGMIRLALRFLKDKSERAPA